MADPLPTRWPQTTIFAAFLVVLALAPLPYGGNTPLAAAWLAVAMGGLVLLWAAAALLTPERLRLSRPVLFAMLASLLVLLWIWVQVRPDVVGLLPGLEAHPVWRAVAGRGGQLEPTIAIDPWGAREAVMRLLTVWAAFWLAFALAQEAGRARQLLTSLVVVGAVYAALGLGLHFAGIEYVLTEEKSWYRGDVTATFVNRNNYATYANLGLLAALGLLVEPFLAARSTDLRRRAAELLTTLTTRKALLLVATLLLATAMLLTHSRGGMLSGLAGILVLLLLALVAARPSLRAGLAGLVLALGLVAALVAYSGAGTLDRLAEIGGDANLAAGTRFAAYERALAMIAERPWIGHGFGGFAATFHLWRDERFHTFFDKLHNTWLEHAVELGLPAAVLLYLGPLVLVAACLRGVFRRRRDQIFPLVAVAASVTVGLHALVDFSLQIPAVAVTYAAVLGCGAAQAMPSARGRGRRGDPATAASPGGSMDRAVAAAA
ncbi:MAG: O-antigen ligase family protein [Geminicoccaceae bacterium]|nr:O-antigen ligase family protein [Geminicoccaceae bacterium]MDW8369488.1 O-antigen ligase family protein [Geminicoccaceae bacterium]